MSENLEAQAAEELAAEMSFDLERIVVPVTINAVKYKLHEADSATVMAHRDAIMKGVSLGAGGQPTGVKGSVSNSDLSLLCSCLHTVGGDGEEAEYVTLSTVQSWPNRVTGPLIKRLRLISGIDEPEKTAKND